MTNKNKKEDKNKGIIQANLQRILFEVGQKISSEFSVNAQKMEQMAPEELKPIVREGKKLFKIMLKNTLNNPQLESLSAMFNKPFLQSMRDSVKNNKDSSSIELGIQLLMQLGIPVLQNLIGHAKSSDPIYHPTHSSPPKKRISSTLPHGQVGREVKVQYHRMTSGNRGK